MEQNLITPKYRFKLKAYIIRAGFRNLSEFAEVIGVDVSRISRVCSGWELPAPRLAKKMANGMGINLKELRELL
ncbi:MAG: helix-turn-helix transcriptional regulator [Deltaproteobacteria bacterium]|nr:helix-turn-helix transcriptional regulator [Deltaproteobacteria bacterium]